MIHSVQELLHPQRLDEDVGYTYLTEHGDRLTNVRAQYHNSGGPSGQSPTWCTEPTVFHIPLILARYHGLTGSPPRKQEAAHTSKAPLFGSAALLLGPVSG